MSIFDVKRDEYEKWKKIIFCIFICTIFINFSGITFQIDIPTEIEDSKKLYFIPMDTTSFTHVFKISNRENNLRILYTLCRMIEYFMVIFLMNLLIKVKIRIYKKRSIYRIYIKLQKLLIPKYYKSRYQDLLFDY
ncbi:hypothetical protein [Inediibacterium massiliense]|uniref:hypothetical protein n=1 Tax=Inediibacterium massiliense TaxID=1658111 RepID=UPI0006B40D68|nr:hypothetical protein [Inediibacterium massiliense]